MEHHPIVIVGAGFGGVGLGAQLRKAGITDFVILERTGDLGGTWSRNTYPGAACDVPSALYSYSFAPNPSWSRKYGTQPEILDYLRGVSDDHGVSAHLRLDTEVLSATFDEDALRRAAMARAGEDGLSDEAWASMRSSISDDLIMLLDPGLVADAGFEIIQSTCEVCVVQEGSQHAVDQR